VIQNDDAMNSDNEDIAEEEDLHEQSPSSEDEREPREKSYNALLQMLAPPLEQPARKKLKTRHKGRDETGEAARALNTVFGGGLKEIYSHDKNHAADATHQDLDVAEESAEEIAADLLEAESENNDAEEDDEDGISFQNISFRHY
jgi:hypothetical protein